MIPTIGKKLVNLEGIPYMSTNLVNFGPEAAENGWRVFANPLNFRIGRNCQPYHRIRCERPLGSRLSYEYCVRALTAGVLVMGRKNTSPLN